METTYNTVVPRVVPENERSHGTRAECVFSTRRRRASGTTEAEA